MLVGKALIKYLTCRRITLSECKLNNKTNRLYGYVDGKCPFDLIKNYISLDSITKLGLSKINPLDVCLIPELLGDKNVNNIKKYLDKNDIEKANIKFIEND